MAAITGWARAEAAASARRLAAIGELVARRTRGADAVNRSRWSCDYWDAAAAEVAAAEQISHGMASSQMYLPSAPWPPELTPSRAPVATPTVRPAAPTPRAANVTVYVLADPAALDTAAEPRFGDGEQTPIAPALKPRPRPAPSGHIIGGGTVPAPLLAQLANSGATVTPLRHPADLPAEPHYRPSTALAAFVRARDLTCRFPGCDQPATHCDIDHAIAYPFGPTHPANLRCRCRKHHLLKTFWTGPGGRHDIQQPDGTVEWTSPTGHTYTTRPGSTLVFPTVCMPNATPPAATSPAPPPAGRGLMMPTRTRTRIQDHAHRINSERALNKAPP